MFKAIIIYYIYIMELSKFKGDYELTRVQQQSICGGLELQECTLTVTIGPWVEDVTSNLYAAGEAGSEEANGDCVDLIVSGIADACSYDCEFDGPG